MTPCFHPSRPPSDHAPRPERHEPLFMPRDLSPSPLVKLEDDVIRPEHYGCGGESGRQREAPEGEREERKPDLRLADVNLDGIVDNRGRHEVNTGNSGTPSTSAGAAGTAPAPGRPSSANPAPTDPHSVHDRKPSAASSASSATLNDDNEEPRYFIPYLDFGPNSNPAARESRPDTGAESSAESAPPAPSALASAPAPAPAPPAASGPQNPAAPTPDEIEVAPELRMFMPRVRRSYGVSGDNLAPANAAPGPVMVVPDVSRLSLTPGPRAVIPSSANASNASSSNSDHRHRPTASSSATLVRSSKALGKRPARTLDSDSDSDVEYLSTKPPSSKRPRNPTETRDIAPKNARAARAQTVSDSDSDSDDKEDATPLRGLTPQQPGATGSSRAAERGGGAGECTACGCTCRSGARGPGSKVLSLQVRRNLQRLLMGDVQPHATHANPLAHITKINPRLTSWREVAAHIGADRGDQERIRQTAAEMMRRPPGL